MTEFTFITFLHNPCLKNSHNIDLGSTPKGLFVVEYQTKLLLPFCFFLCLLLFGFPLGFGLFLLSQSSIDTGFHLVDLLLDFFDLFLFFKPKDLSSADLALALALALSAGWLTFFLVALLSFFYTLINNLFK